jgi:hypothetical protein
VNSCGKNSKGRQQKGRESFKKLMWMDGELHVPNLMCGVSGGLLSSL